jgi:hypothetical protein
MTRTLRSPTYRRIALSSWTLGSNLMAAPAAACPDCSIGRQARALVWSDGFAQNVMAAALPFAFIVAVALWAEWAKRS